MSKYDIAFSNGLNWWKTDPSLFHENIVTYINYIEQDQGYKSSDNLRYMRLYGNYEMMGLNSFSYSRNELSSGNVTHRVTLNVIQSIIDTVMSKMAKNKPKPTFLTDGGDWSLQRKAKKLTKFCEGIFSSTNFYKQAQQAMRDACIFGTGAIKIYKEDGNIKAERVFIEEIKIDDRECYYGTARQMHQVKYVHKSVLKEMFPEDSYWIDESTDSDYTGSPNLKNNETHVKVIESWHLPSGKTEDENGKPIKHDGVHTITISNRTLFTEPYCKGYFPFVFFRWNEKPIGFWGCGIAEQLQGLQLEINKILRTIQISMHLCSIPKLFVEASSKVVTAHLNNKIGGIIKYAGTPPKYEPLGGVPAELFTHLDRLYSRAYEISGVSQLSAQSLKPAGIESGKALREYNDIESERFLEVGQRYERSFIDAARIIVDMAREIYKEEGSFKVKVKGKKFIETIDWSEVDIADDQFLMDIFPTSALSNTPSGRLQDVQELLQAGFITKEDATKLLDFPDLEQTMNKINAGIEDIERMIELMIDKGEYQTPEPYQNLEMGIKMMQQSYLFYRSEGAPEEKLELLRRWMEDAQSLLLKAREGLNNPPPMPQTQVPITNNSPEAIAQGQMPAEELQQVPPTEPII